MLVILRNEVLSEGFVILKRAGDPVFLGRLAGDEWLRAARTERADSIVLAGPDYDRVYRRKLPDGREIP